MICPKFSLHGEPKNKDIKCLTPRIKHMTSVRNDFLSALTKFPCLHKLKMV